MTTRALTMLNEAGDTTIVWDEDGDDRMRRIIEARMKAGVSFFIIEPRFFGLLPPKRTELKAFDKALEHRALSIPDEDLAAFVGDGGASAVKTPAAPVRGARRSKDAGEVATSESVAVRPLQGG